MLACPDDAKDSADTGNPVQGCDPASANVVGTVTNPMEYCSVEPDTVEFWSLSGAGTVCYEQWMAYDSAGNDGGWEDWRGELVATAAITDRHFEALVTAGERVGFADKGCFACEPFAAVADDCTELTMQLEERISVDAPNVYLYPEAPTPVTVRVGRPAAVTVAIPAYPLDGWLVLAEPDGTLRLGQSSFDYLFYELLTREEEYQYEEGWCVPGELAQATVEDAMFDLGFIEPELEDFRDYWDAAWPSAELVGIYPQFDLPALKIRPEPDTLLRAWFVVTPRCDAKRLPELSHTERVGFTATEWGVIVAPPLPRVEAWRVERP